MIELVESCYSEFVGDVMRSISSTGNLENVKFLVESNKVKLAIQAYLEFKSNEIKLIL